MNADDDWMLKMHIKKNGKTVCGAITGRMWNCCKDKKGVLFMEVTEMLKEVNNER